MDQYTQTEPSPPAEKKPTQAPEKKQITAGEAALKGGLDAITFGTHPAIHGLAEASGVPAPDMEEEVSLGEAAKRIGQFISRPFIGAFKAAHGDPDALDAYEKGRAGEATETEAARTQHPLEFLAGQFGGSLATPAFGALKAGGLGARFVAGARGGAIGGGAYGVGTQVGQGETDPAAIAKQGTRGAIEGAALGGPLGAVLGPRGLSRAGQVAESLGAPLPRGVASASPTVQALTARSKIVPLVGEKISGKVAKTIEAAGEKTTGIARELTGGQLDRPSLGLSLRDSLENSIERGKNKMNDLYGSEQGQVGSRNYQPGSLRSMLDLSKNAPLTETQPVLDQILNRLRGTGKVYQKGGSEAGIPDILQQVERVAKRGGGSFDNIQGLRSDVRDAASILEAHPGLNKGDANRLVASLSKDLENSVRDTTTANPQLAVAAFKKAEQNASDTIERNKQISKLLRTGSDEVLAGKLGNLLQEKTGNVRFLNDLKKALPPDEFAVIGGSALHDLGYNATVKGEFDINKFAKNWKDVSAEAKKAMFSPEHMKWIDDVAHLGEHIKGASSYQNHSNTAGAFWLFEMLSTGGEIGAAALAGDVSKKLIGTVAGGAAMPFVFAFGLSRPATSASMSAWARAYRGLTMDRPTPARLATFNMATRNLANTFNFPADQVMGSAHSLLKQVGIAN